MPVGHSSCLVLAAFKLLCSWCGFWPCLPVVPHLSACQRQLPCFWWKTQSSSFLLFTLSKQIRYFGSGFRLSIAPEKLLSTCRELQGRAGTTAKLARAKMMHKLEVCNTHEQIKWYLKTIKSRNVLHEIWELRQNYPIEMYSFLPHVPPCTQRQRQEQVRFVQVQRTITSKKKFWYTASTLRL